MGSNGTRQHASSKRLEPGGIRYLARDTKRLDLLMEATGYRPAEKLVRYLTALGDAYLRSVREKRQIIVIAYDDLGEIARKEPFDYYWIPPAEGGAAKFLDLRNGWRACDNMRLRRLMIQFGPSSSEDLVNYLIGLAEKVMGHRSQFDDVILFLPDADGKERPIHLDLL